MNGTLVNAVIPEGVTKIPDQLFMYWFDLETIIFPKTLKEIGNYSLSCCELLPTPILPEGLEKIGEFAFEYCFGFGGEFVFPSTIKEVGRSLFGEDDSPLLDTIIFKGTPTKIDTAAFDFDMVDTIEVPWSEGEVAGAPWGAASADILYDCEV